MKENGGSLFHNFAEEVLKGRFLNRMVLFLFGCSCGIARPPIHAV